MATDTTELHEQHRRLRHPQPQDTTTNAQQS